MHVEPLPSEDGFDDALKLVHAFDDGPRPTGVAVSRLGRIFVSFPRWLDNRWSVEATDITVAEIRNGEILPFPSKWWNRPNDQTALVSVQSVVIDAADRLWMLDTGRQGSELAREGGPKLVGVDLTGDQDVRPQVVVLPPEVALPTTYLNDVRFDLTRGNGGIAYISDSSHDGPNGLIIVDLDTQQAWRRLHDHPTTKAERPPGFAPIVEGQPLLVREKDKPAKPLTTGVDGIAITLDGHRIWYCPLASRRWYSVSAERLRDRKFDDHEVELTVIDEGDKGGAADGLEADNKGRIYATNWEHNAILRRHPEGRLETVVHDARLLWPDALAVAVRDETYWLYVTANQLHRRWRLDADGKDTRKYPYALFRISIDAGPVWLPPAG